MSFEKGFKFEIENLIKNSQIESLLETRSDFLLLNILGRGSFGQVCQVKHLATNEK